MNSGYLSLDQMCLGLLICCCLAFWGCGSDEPPTPYVEGPVPFWHSVIDEQPPGGEDCCTDILATGDLSGDGYPDLIIGSQHGDGPDLVWYEYPDWNRHDIGSGNFTTDAQTGDVDRDGDEDIVISEKGRGIFWYENPDRSDTADWIAHHIGDGHGHDVEIGDLDGDGDLDVVTCSKKQLQVWFQESPDSWSGRLLLERLGEGTALADLDDDGDLDVVRGGTWLENPADPHQDSWPEHVFQPDWHPAARVRTCDLNGDGRLDVVLAVSEAEGPVTWFEAPDDPRQEDWTSHPVESGSLSGAHSLQICDLDLDDDPDIVTAEMHTSDKSRVLIYLNESGSWQRSILSRNGSHNLQVADIDSDGDWDLIGKNYAGPERVLEMWENLQADQAEVPAPVQAGTQISGWEYIPLDENRGPEQHRMMGLVFVDADHDGWQDIVAGSLLYHNPRGDLAAEWRRTALPETVDVHFALDVDGDEFTDLVGFRKENMVWLEANDPGATTWSARHVGSVPPGRTQGYQTAQIIPGPPSELVFTRGKNLLYAILPKNDALNTPWTVVRISDESEEEGCAVGDIDRDGDLDVAAHDASGHLAVWLENRVDPAVGYPNTSGDDFWPRHVVGPSPRRLDRVGLADLDSDGRLDIVATQESRDWHYNARLLWFSAPSDPRADGWQRHTVATLRSLNSLDLADLDGDGSVDLVVAEHTDQRPEKVAEDNFTAIFYNRDHGKRWPLEVVEIGPHSSHLGARLCDLDNDGNPEMISIAWKQYRSLHLWRRPSPGAASQE